MERTTHQSFCRICHDACPILVEVEKGRAVKVTGDPSGPFHHGYTCVKGRAIPEIENSPTRLLQSMKRVGDSFSPIPSGTAIAEIAERLRGIVDEHGPRSVALYVGTSIAGKSPAALRMTEAFMDAIGSPMRFTANTIDQPGKMIAKGFHGVWLAPSHIEPDVVLMFGRNPLVSHSGGGLGDPGAYFKALRARGAKLIVADPRRTQVAAKADIHLQVRPGEDVALLAGMLHVILAERLYDAEFVAENVTGVDELRAAVEAWTPQRAADRAGVDVDDLVRAARMFAGAKRGCARAGTGPNMGTGHGTLVEYLVLAMDSLCGNYLRAGDQVPNPGTLLPLQKQKAQALPPFPAYGFGEKMRVRGLANTLAGLQTAALPEEILLPGEGQVRALLVSTGNPVAMFPDQLLTIEALKSLDLLVTIDVQMSQTAKLADYVIAPTMSLEVPGMTMAQDWIISYSNGIGGFREPAAQYSAPVTVRPPGSDLVEEWEVFYRIAAHMGLQLRMRPGWPFTDQAPAPIDIDMVNKPTTDELFDLMACDARIPVDELRRNPGMRIYPAETYVAPKDPDATGRLDVGNAEMLRDLTELDRSGDVTAPIGDGFDFRLLCRRVMHTYNSVCNIPATNRGRGHNLAFLHPEDLADLGLREHDTVKITSARASIPAVVASDRGLRRGSISMTHGLGGDPSDDPDFLAIGSPTGRLLSTGLVYDRYSGQPLMSNIPVKVTPMPELATTTG
jgi:anaerobic selenocysteine-containing dehydrogenase